MKTSEFNFPSATGVCEIQAYRYVPDEDYDTVLVINHGMAEEHKRYEEFAGLLCKKGVAVYIHDMAGHGRSCTDPSLTGWFGEKDGYLGLVEDLHTMVTRAVSQNPGRRILVMGHSMGSFICRLYVSRYHEDGIEGAIFMGTGGPNPGASFVRGLASFIGSIRGKKRKSNFLHVIVFCTYGKGFEGRTAFDWLSRDPAVADRYIENPDHDFLFTIQGMHDLISANMACNSDEWYKNVPTDLPILLVSGEQDPVGDHSRGVIAVYDRLKETGHDKAVKMIYKDCRHEVLNELNKEEVMEDIYKWISGQLSKE